ncbi:integrase [Betaproteobacteria bacterium]|nr:integrase [Betaproteobacteria bacterium]
MALSDTALRAAKPAPKDYRISDDRGLYLLVKAKGGKLWRFDYRHGFKPGTEKPRRLTLALGIYPDVSLKEARAQLNEARKLLAQGIDPGAKRKAQKAAELESAVNTFAAIAREWHEGWKTRVTPAVQTRIWSMLERDVIPFIGDIPIVNVKATQILGVLRRLEARGLTDSVRKTKSCISQVMCYAIATERIEYDPCPSLNKALKKIESGHMAALIDPASVGEFLHAAEGYTGSHVVRAALMLMPLVFVRPGELRSARWKDINLEKGEWRYFVTKTKTDHLVPLARQAVAILQELYKLTWNSDWVFPNVRRGRPMSDGTVNRALQTMGYNTKTEVTGHGFRATARTLLAEELGFDPLVIEHQLAHAVPDNLGNAYNRTTYLKQRQKMMQAWANYLDKLKNVKADGKAK